MVYSASLPTSVLKDWLRCFLTLSQDTTHMPVCSLKAIFGFSRRFSYSFHVHLAWVYCFDVYFKQDNANFATAFTVLHK